MQEDNDRLRADLATGPRPGWGRSSSSGGIVVGGPASTSAPLVVRLTKEQQAVLQAAQEAVLANGGLVAEPGDLGPEASQGEAMAAGDDPVGDGEDDGVDGSLGPVGEAAADDDAASLGSEDENEAGGRTGTADGT